MCRRRWIQVHLNTSSYSPPYFIFPSLLLSNYMCRIYIQATPIATLQEYVGMPVFKEIGPLIMDQGIEKEVNSILQAQYYQGKFKLETSDIQLVTLPFILSIIPFPFSSLPLPSPFFALFSFSFPSALSLFQFSSHPPLSIPFSIPLPIDLFPLGPNLGKR